MLDYSFSREFVDDGAWGRTFWDVDVLSVFRVGDGFVEVGVGPGSETRLLPARPPQLSKVSAASFVFMCPGSLDRSYLKRRHRTPGVLSFNANSFLISRQKIPKDQCCRFTIDERRNLVGRHPFGL